VLEIKGVQVLKVLKTLQAKGRAVEDVETIWRADLG